jgi:transcription termination factor Rho
LRNDAPGRPDYTNRVIDLLCPLGKGQRALVVAPAKAGKTTILQSIAEGLTRTIRRWRSTFCWWMSGPKK